MCIYVPKIIKIGCTKKKLLFLVTTYKNVMLHFTYVSSPLSWEYVFTGNFQSKLRYTGCPKKNGTQVNGYNFVMAYSYFLKFRIHKVKVLNDKHTKNQVNRTRKTCFTRYCIPVTIFAKRVPSAAPRAGCRL